MICDRNDTSVRRGSLGDRACQLPLCCGPPFHIGMMLQFPQKGQPNSTLMAKFILNLCHIPILQPHISYSVSFVSHNIGLVVNCKFFPQMQRKLDK